MIPTQQVNGLSVADLPVRATQVAPEALTLGGARKLVGQTALRRNQYPNTQARKRGCTRFCLEVYDAPASSRDWTYSPPTLFTCFCYK